MVDRKKMPPRQLIDPFNKNPLMAFGIEHDTRYRAAVGPLICWWQIAMKLDCSGAHREFEEWRLDPVSAWDRARALRSCDNWTRQWINEPRQGFRIEDPHSLGLRPPAYGRRDRLRGNRGDGD